jgi:TatD family-associated radical SAM protein
MDQGVHRGPRLLYASMSAPTIHYDLHGNRYLNVTSRCTLRCRFCPKFNGVWTVSDYDLRLHADPDAEQLIAAVDDPGAFQEIVFCGFGEPTLRLYTVLEAGTELRQRGGRVRLNTDGLANLVHGRDVTPDLEDSIDAISISLNAQNEDLYNHHCRPPQPGAFAAVLDFATHVREFVPSVTLTAIDGLAGVDIAACQAIAERLGVGFRRRELGKVG